MTMVSASVETCGNGFGTGSTNEVFDVEVVALVTGACTSVRCKTRMTIRSKGRVRVGKDRRLRVEGV